jgi:hypothetical protein
VSVIDAFLKKISLAASTEYSFNVLRSSSASPARIHAVYILHNTHPNPTTNATVTPRTSHLPLRGRLRQPAVM